jgi:hypothetical protein
LALACTFSVPRARFLFVCSRKLRKTHQGLRPLEYRRRHRFGAPCPKRDAVRWPQPVPGPPPVKSWPNLYKSTRLVAGLLSFSTRVPWSLALFFRLPSLLALLACSLHRNIHTLLVAARCRHSLRHRLPAGLPLRSLTDCFISSHPFITVEPSRAASQSNTQQQTKQTRPPAARTRLSLLDLDLDLSDLSHHKAASCDPLYHEAISQLGYLQPLGSRFLGSTTLCKQIANTLPAAV